VILNKNKEIQSNLVHQSV